MNCRGHIEGLTTSENTIVSKFMRCTHKRTTRALRFEGCQANHEAFLLKEYHEDWQFDCEEGSYRLLKGLQGDIVPRYFGSFQRPGGNKVAVIELLNGRNLESATVASQHVRHLRQALDFCYRELAERDVCQSDPTKSNVMLVELTGRAYLSSLPHMMSVGSQRNIAITSSGRLGVYGCLVPWVIYTGLLWLIGVETLYLKVVFLLTVRHAFSYTLHTD